MPDIRQAAAFATAVAGARAAINQLHLRHRIPDATALYQRGRNVNNLSGHAHSIIPLAVLIAREYPALLAFIRARTDLQRAMTARSLEARDRYLWRKVMNATKVLLADRGPDIIAEELATGVAQSARRIARTYLSTAFGGRQTRGGAGNTVIKRTLKLLAHLQHE
jgi:hypothetical protein